MEKPTVLWVGENRQRCVTLMRIYADLIRSVYAEKTDPGFLSGFGKELSAIVLVLGYDERADTAVCREVYTHSFKKRVPIFLMGQLFHLHTAAMIAPRAELIPVRDDRLAEAFTKRGTARSSPVPAVAVFSGFAECFVYFENELSEKLRGKLRLIYSELSAEAFRRLKRKGIKPKLLVFGEDVYDGPRRVLIRSVYRQAWFRRIPYLLLSFSEREREPDELIPEPLAVLTIGEENSAAEKYVRAAAKIK